jgi:hypothetical protein
MVFLMLFFCCRVCLGENLRLQGSFFGLLVDILGQILLGLFWPPHGPFVSFFFFIILVPFLTACPKSALHFFSFLSDSPQFQED